MLGPDRGVKKKRNRGQAIVEFALILPIFLLLVLGSMEFGLVFHQYQIVTSASREGARAATLGGTDAEVRAAVNSAASTINSGALTTTISPAARVRGNAVTVTVTNPVTIQTPLIAQLITPNPYPVTGKTVMRME
jgi:Flp pilus assembly protein TadG